MLEPLHPASSQSWRAVQHSRRSLLAVAGAGGRRVQPSSAQQKASVQQQQQQTSWLQACERVAAFQLQHGRLPRAIVDAQGPLLPGERQLGVWCTEQLRRKAGSKVPPLSAEERRALTAIPGWRWWATRRVRKPWEERRQEVEVFYQQHGRLPRMSAGQSMPFLPGEEALGLWINLQRNKFRGHAQPPLSAERIAALDRTPGWSWGEYLLEPWESRCQQLQKFVRQHGRLPRKASSTSAPFLPCERGLGKWVGTQRKQYKAQKLSAEQREALEATPGWCWAEWTQEAWEVRLQQVQSFVRQHGRLPRQQASKHMPLQPSERLLAVWCLLQRQRCKGNVQQPLTTEQQVALAAVPGWYWDEDDRWEQQRQQLEAFVLRHQRMPRRQATLKEPLLEGEQKLGVWWQLQWQRERGKGAPLTAKQVAALESIPPWGSQEGLPTQAARW